MQNAKSTKGETNCIGTILYVSGVIRKDEYLGTDSRRWRNRIVDKFLDKLVPINKPIEDSVLVIRDKHRKKRIEHMAIVTSMNPPTVYHRIGNNKKIVPNDSLDQVLKDYDEFTHKFYARSSSLKKSQ
tara:strand:+ start:377 stop:760 length:384 start_codon:yes stop_codon:yes gene_type:complete